MNREQLLKMDPFMLLSIVNMKLRDEFDSLDTLCEDYDMEKQELINRLEEIGYRYRENTNQFVAVEDD